VTNEPLSLKISQVKFLHQNTELPVASAAQLIHEDFNVVCVLLQGGVHGTRRHVHVVNVNEPQKLLLHRNTETLISLLVFVELPRLQA
jgi:hypothetical protein